MIDPETIAEWRKEQGNGMTSALGEYTPEEFWVLLDEYEALLKLARGMIPKNVNLNHPRWPDSTVIPLDTTLGELRELRDAVGEA